MDEDDLVALVVLLDAPEAQRIAEPDRAMRAATRGGGAYPVAKSRHQVGSLPMQKNRLVTALIAGLGVSGCLLALPAQAAPPSTKLTVKSDESGPTATVAKLGSQSVVMRSWDDKTLKTALPKHQYAKRGVQESAKSAAAPTPEVAYTVNSDGTVVNRSVIRLDGRPADPKDGRVPVQWAVDKDSISLAWWSPAKSISWTLSMDGKPVTKTTATTWSTHFPDSSKHTFEADGVQKVVMSDGRTQSAPFTYSVTTQPADSIAIGKRVDDPFVASQAANRDLVGRAAEADVEAGLSYRAFIPSKYVPGPPFCQVTTNKQYAYYGGDNRGFSADIYDHVDKSRVSIDRTVGFSSSGSVLYPLGRYTGDTKAYDKNYKLLATKNAGPSATDITDVNGKTSTRLTGTLTIKGANPLCNGTPSIDGKVHYDLRKTGALNFSGVHDQAPSHEVIYYYGDWRSGVASTGRAYGRSLTSFNCLAGPPVCADATFNVTVQAAEI